MSSPPKADASHTTNSPRHAVGHETKDVDPAGVLWLALAVAMVVGAAQVALLVFQDYMQRSATAKDPPRSPVADVRQSPPEPRLQQHPARDYQKYLRQQQDVLNSYGWIDKQQKISRIPIDRAMNLLLERGIQTPAPAGEAPASESDAPAENDDPTESDAPAETDAAADETSNSQP